MLHYLFALSFLFNFFYGVLLPIVPHLNTETAGWAFTVFLLFKLIWFIPAGIVSDRIGHGRALTLALVMQTGALVVIASFPQLPWLGRALEGMALAQGTLSTFAYMRWLTPDAREFEKAVAKLLGIGGLGIIAGPAVGYLLLPYGAVKAVLGLAALNSLFLIGQLKMFTEPAAPASGQFTLESSPRAGLVWFVLGLTAAKALAVGWEPNLAWWAIGPLGFAPLVAGLSFLVLGIAFVVGSLRPNPWLTPISFLGFFLLELALAGRSFAWWPALAAVGFWYGIYVSISVSRLGWNKPEQVGRFNSVWMLITDLPMALVPSILWQWRSVDSVIPRATLGGILLLISAISLAFGLWQDSRVPIRSSRS